MKKYLIVNDDGTKKTVYAKDLMQALKLGDAINITPGMFITLKADPLHSVYRVKEINRGEYGVVLVRYSIWAGQLVERDAGSNYSFASLKKNVTNIFNTYDEAKKYLLHHDAVRTAGLKPLRKKNDSADAAVIDKPIDTVDEASLATSINALVTDEEAAIDAYNVAIKNLEGKIDENAKQVLINIRDDERRHIENLYAILNNQVTEKNLEDSIKDAAPGVDKKKFDRLVNYFNAWGKPSRNELQEVIDYYRLNSATAYQLLYYWGYKNEFEKLHFYDSRIKDAFEVLWYTDEKLNNYETKEFKSRAAAMDFYNAHKNDKDKFGWWVTRRNSDWAVVEDIVY